MSTTTKTEQRRRTIQRGTTKGAALGERALAAAAIEEIRHISGQTHTDHGANTAEEIQLGVELAESLAADSYSAPRDDLAADLAPDLFSRNDPILNVPVSMLLSDLRRRVKTWTRGYGREERTDIATDALLLLARWNKQGATAPIYLGQRGALPLRREWFDPEARTVIRDGLSTRPAPCQRAERAMRAAILQAVRDRNSDAAAALARKLAELDELSTDADYSESTLAAQALRESEEAAELAPSLPDTDAAELLSEAMGVTLTAARALAAKGWRLTARQCAELWNVTKSRAENILSEGARELRTRWPDSADLLDALAAAAPTLRELLATRAYQALADLQEGIPWRDPAELLARAELAVSEYLSACDVLPMERRALELAAHRVGWEPEADVTSAEHILRLLRAELRRAEHTSAAASHGSVLRTCAVSPARELNGSELAARRRPLKRQARVRSQLTPAARRWSYGLEAATAREIRRVDDALETLRAAACELAELLR